MKLFNLLLCLLLLASFSCSKRKIIQEDKEKCFPASVLIFPFGDGNKPSHPLLIRTEEIDTTYYKYDVEDNLENMERIGFIFRKDVYFLDYKINSKTIDLVKEYIATHNTYRNYTMLDGDCNTIKIVFEDQCDSIVYTVNRSDSGYFSNMIDSVKPDAKLREYLEYYQRIQERSYE